jgi:hypothetical protein
MNKADMVVLVTLLWVAAGASMAAVALNYLVGVVEFRDWKWPWR